MNNKHKYSIDTKRWRLQTSTQKRNAFQLTDVLTSLAVAVALSLCSQSPASAAGGGGSGGGGGGPNIPTDLSPSPLFGATQFSQQMLRFEEFGLHPLPAPATATAKTLPTPNGCDGRPNISAMDTFLSDPLWPAPTEQSNIASGNPWASFIQPCVGLPVSFTGVIEGRAPGTSFAHQRWGEFPPQRYFQTAMGGARINHGLRDDEQSHGYTVGEFGSTLTSETGLYHHVTGVPSGGPGGTTNTVEVKFHPSMPAQDPQSVWTFGDGTLPPKLLRARYGEPILFRHYNALPIDVSANNGFGEHTITTHEHNGHTPGESDGFAAAFFYPGEFYDYRWPLQLAGYDSINTDASDPRASTPCLPTEDLNGNNILDAGEDRNNNGILDPAEVMMISDSITHLPVAKVCDPVTHTVNIPGDWHETMSTHWFHDHMLDRTAPNVYKGNAAMMNYYSGVDRGKEGFRCNYDAPANNINLCFPSGTALSWGNRDYDVQLSLADKAWDTQGQLDFAPMNTDGFLGDRMTVNWLYDPYFEVRARRYRFRMLDASVSRFFKIAIVQEIDGSGGELPGQNGKTYHRVPFHMIANDGNIMEHAVPFPNAQSNDLPVMGVAERHDIVVDFSQFPVGTKLYMVNTLDFVDGRGPKNIIPLADILDGTFAPSSATGAWDEDPGVGKFLEFRVQPYSGTDLSMNPVDYEVGKKMMIPLVKFTDAELATAKHRTFVFGRGGGISTDGQSTPWTIATDGGSSLNADMNRVSAAPETMGGGVEIWHIVNGGGGWAHPVHIHFEEGQILLRGDNVFGVDVKHLPPLWEIGARKDVYRVGPLGIGTGIADSSMIIDVAIRFREFAGTYMEHCHNTQHEDKSMLLRWDNEHPGETIRIPTPIPSWNGVKYVSVANPILRQDGTLATGVDELLTIKTGDLAAVPPLCTVLPNTCFVPPNQILGDLDGDGLVGFSDFSIFRSQFGFPGLWASNLDEDALVGFSDFSLLRTNFGLSAGFPLPGDNLLP